VLFLSFALLYVVSSLFRAYPDSYSWSPMEKDSISSPSFLSLHYLISLSFVDKGNKDTNTGKNILFKKWYWEH
jgi:hypothetical protein